MQSFDYTTLMAVCDELRTNWLPARVEQVYQCDRVTISIALRTLQTRGWLEISWHPQAARVHMGNPPPRKPDTFTFSQQLIHQLGGLALVKIESIASWERVIDLQFARRPGEDALYHVYVEIMGKYSNVVLTDNKNEIITVAHQVTQNQSSVRPILTGQPYQTPPSLTGSIPNREEPLQLWRDRISLIPGTFKKQLLKTYRGVSPALIQGMLREVNLDLDVTTETLSDAHWLRLFSLWGEWLERIDARKYNPMTTVDGYNVLGWGGIEIVENSQTLVNNYYTDVLSAQAFVQLRHQLQQKINNWLAKLRTKAQTFTQRLSQSDRAEEYRQNADLLMAYLHKWEPGMSEITLPDFETGQPVTIKLEPDKTAVHNAQNLYKQHQKLKRARVAVEPLLAEVNAEIAYIEQVESAIGQLDTYESVDDLDAIAEIRDELISQKYLEDSEYRQRSHNEASTNFHRFRTPNGFEVLIGRNNRQNDYLSFRIAGDYDLWFHAQEIPGSHVLLRLEPGAVADEADLQFTANLTAYYSRARHSEQVPVIYTEPKHVYKPKGAKPGIAIYKHERILWGNPVQV